MIKEDVIQVIGIKNWWTFERWIAGQTVGMITVFKNGKYVVEIDYYNYDIERFCRNANIPFWIPNFGKN